ncbi:unnamed protein product [Arctogadus glacialis]
MNHCYPIISLHKMSFPHLHDSKHTAAVCLATAAVSTGFTGPRSQHLSPSGTGAPEACGPPEGGDKDP